MASSPKRILVPRLVDGDNHGAQSLNARAMLSRFSDDEAEWHAVHLGSADAAVASNPRVRLSHLCPGRLWKLDLVRHYARAADALFYPGVEWMDDRGTGIASWLRRGRPLIATMEGVAGTPARRSDLVRWAGHEVACQPVSPEVEKRIDRILLRADHIIAISPFLARMGRNLYGDKVSVQALGIDRKIFFPAQSRDAGLRAKVLAAGHVTGAKRPEIMLALAEAIPEAEFVWIGAGPLLDEMRRRAKDAGLRNVEFKGPATPEGVAQAMRRAAVFVHPSLAEGVPKVAQEAAACGVPVVLFGHYESPTVVDAVNGHVVWSDADFVRRVKELVQDPEKARRLGARGAEAARGWDWDLVAPAWEKLVLAMLGG